MKLKMVLCATTLALASVAAHADDWGCTVVLCLANPKGPTAVSECVPPIKKLWSELAKGHAFPSCDMNSSGASGNSASHQWSSGNNCPPQYQYYGGADNSELLCSMAGVVSININNKPYNRVWWNGSNTMTDNLSSEAASVPGASTQYQQDLAAWKARQAAIAASSASQGGN
jgi:hypothetical protein